MEVSEKLPESAILVELEVLDDVERLRASVILAVEVDVDVVFPEFETVDVVDETFPESVTRVDVVVVLGAETVEVETFPESLTRVDVVVVLGAETVVDETFPESLTRADVVVVVLGALVVVVVFVVVGAFVVVVVVFVVALAVVVFVFATDELSANFHVLKRPLESRTTSRTRPSDHVSVATLPHVTK